MTGATYRNLTLSVPLIAAIAFLYAAWPITWLEVATLPLCFVAFNLMEYLLHRGPMHRGILIEHTRVHHGCFHARHLYIAKDADNFAAVTPLYVCFAVAGMTGVPALLLGWHWAAFIIGCSLAYYFVEELLHYIAHARRTWRFGQHHLQHHLMMACNYNINFPLCDWLFGTSHSRFLRRSAKEK